MPTKKIPFTFDEDFQIIPMSAGSFMVDQGMTFSQAFSDIDQVVLFLISEKDKYLTAVGALPIEMPPPNTPYEPYDRTGTPGYGKEDDE